MHPQLPALHALQAQIVAHDARFKVLACGRRFGKTTLAIAEMTRVLDSGGHVAYFAPTYRMVSEVWRSLKRITKPHTATRHEHEHRIELHNGSTAECWSLKSADTVRGRAYDLVVIDEAAQFAPLDEAWNGAIRPLLTDRLGRAIFLSTPRGRNFFYQLYQMGQDPHNPDWASFHAPTSANPFIEPAEIESARMTMPIRLFSQEYLAEFLADSGAVFRNVHACSVLSPALPSDFPDETRFVAGVDWGRSDDFTVMCIMNADTGHEVALERFREVGWAIQRERIASLATDWRVAHIIGEANSIGEPNIQALQADGLPIIGFTMTAKSKSPLIEDLALALEREHIRLIADPIATSELVAYQAERLTSGGWRYNAPRGGHDDTVIARALAWMAVHERPTTLEFSDVNIFRRR
ncbi:MAG: terminase family protein [Anaerolineae bacterium]|nr:terminase family protein [Anaerolineae bacterium]